MLFVLVMSIALSVFVFAVSDDAAFENSIAEFPESYKVYLRQLHVMYPDWEFKALKTGLDWNTVIDNELGNKSLVDLSVADEDLKSKAIGDYNYSTGKYIQKDGGFVVANRLAVEYYMDPRNFLKEEHIFQFEDLGFDAAITQADVEAILKGTFMANANMNYYDSKGTYYSFDKTYSAAIYEAGKKYGINPCFLASKIKNEVGTNGSGSTSGKHSSYPGIYNFYNIGAYDGANAISKGLKWASEGSSYGRPWTTPYKSITGGAQWIADNYVKTGQHTGYLQRFNVNPNGKYKLYDHQYMTNLTGAVSQGYTTYTSYVKSGSLNRKIVFTIPVFENMSEVSENKVKNNADSAVQTGVICTDPSSPVNIRTGPSTGYAVLLDSNNNQIKLSNNHNIKIEAKCITDSTNITNMLKYPHWYKITFTYNSKSYTGYVTSRFVSIQSSTSVPAGDYSLNYIKSKTAGMNVVSSDPNIATVTSSSVVNFIKGGTVYLLTFDSTGNVDKVKYVVEDTLGSTSVSGISVSKTANSLKFTADKRTDATKYQFTLFDYVTGKIISTASTANNYYTFKSLEGGKRYSCVVSCLLSSDSATKYGASKTISSFTAPAAPSSVKSEIVDIGVKISWKSVANATKYYIYGYDTETAKYTKITNTSKTNVTLSYDKLIYDAYAVRSYTKDSLGEEYGLYSELITISLLPVTPNNVAIESLTSNGYALKWDEVKGVEGYQVYRYDSEQGKYVLLVDTILNNITVESLSAGQSDKYKIRSYKTINGEKKYSAYTNVLTITTLTDKIKSVTSYDLTDKAVSLKWAKVNGATLYRVYRINGAKKTLVAETKNLNVTVSKLSAFTKYTFSVVPCVENLTVVYEGKSATNCNVRTNVAKVSDLSVKSVGADYIELKWSKASAATKYYIYSYDSSTKKYTSVANTTSTSYKVKKLKVNTSYKYAVRAAAVLSDDGKTYYSAYSNIVSSKTAVPVAKGLGSSDATASSYKLKWTAVSGAVSYNVYRKVDGEYKKIGSTKTNSYNVTGRKTGKKEYYKIKTVMSINSKNYESAFSSELKAATLPAKVTSVKVTPSVTSMKITWKAVSGADKYRIYIYSDKEGKYVKNLDVTTTSCTLKSLTSGKTYKIAVRAFISVTGSSVYSSFAKATATTQPSSVTSVKVSSAKTDSHVLSWSKASKANYYYIYRYNPSTDSYVNIGSTSKTSYTVSKLSAGKTYKYKIYSAILSNGKCIVKGKASSVYSFSTLPSKVTSLKGSTTKNSIKLTWSKVSGATAYEIYYYDADAEAYFMAGTVDTNSFTIKNLASGSKYKFKVRAIRKVSGTLYKGSYSSALEVKTK